MESSKQSRKEEFSIKKSRRGSAKTLETFIRSRPTSQRLEDINILKSGTDGVSPKLVEAREKLTKERTKVGLQKLLNLRPDREFLEKQNIIRGSAGVDPKNVAVQEHLIKRMIQNKLERGISKRPSIDSLQKRGIIKEYSAERVDNITPDEARAVFLRIMNKGGPLTRELANELRKYRIERSADEKAFDNMKLERSLMLRPSRDKLIDSNVIKMAGSSSASRLLATRVLAGKIGTRPTMDSLVEKGVLEPRSVISEEEEEE